jgi:hypothetical protein
MRMETPKKVAGVLFAAAMVLPIGLVVSPAAAGPVQLGTTCKTVKGTGKFTPALPPLSSKTKVQARFDDRLTVTGCTGGGVTGGVGPVAIRTYGKTGANCATFTTASTTTPLMTGTQTITWNIKKTSTVSVTMRKAAPPKGKIPPEWRVTVTGKVTAGLFAGRTMSENLDLLLPKGGCTGDPLASSNINSSRSNVNFA